MAPIRDAIGRLGFVLFGAVLGAGFALAVVLYSPSGLIAARAQRDAIEADARLVAGNLGRIIADGRRVRSALDGAQRLLDAGGTFADRLRAYSRAVAGYGAETDKYIGELEAELERLRAATAPMESVRSRQRDRMPNSSPNLSDTEELK